MKKKLLQSTGAKEKPTSSKSKSKKSKKQQKGNQKEHDLAAKEMTSSAMVSDNESESFYQNSTENASSLLANSVVETGNYFLSNEVFKYLVCTI